jgi:hypothetical protein
MLGGSFFFLVVFVDAMIMGDNLFYFNILKFILYAK